MNKFIKSTAIITLLIFLRVGFALAADQVYFYYTDPAGSPLAMSDSTGTVVWRADYLPFGEETIDQSTVQNNKMFVGKEKDSESGLYYFGARYMDSAAGRFVSTDVINAVDATTGKINDKALLNPQLLNRYAYSLNNPYKYFDPDGRATYQVNRSFGNDPKEAKSRSTWNPASHTFIAVTNSGGEVIATYSWGNASAYNDDFIPKTKWAKPNQAEDIEAAKKAISSGDAFMISEGLLDTYVTSAYQQLSESEGSRIWNLFDSCKHESKELLDKAFKLLDKDLKK